MQQAQIPENEAERLAALFAYDILDTGGEQAFDDLTQIASSVCETPIALISLVDEGRQWFKSKLGLAASETPRQVAFCSHAILGPDEVFVVEDSSRDARFHDNPLVLGPPNVSFYAGAPLVNASGLAVGTLCVIDHKPRTLSDEQLETLRALSRQVVCQLELRKSNKEHQAALCDLGRTNRELQQFTAIAAHDLQEPLRKLVSFSDLLVEDLGDALPEPASQDLGCIVEASRQMRHLVNDLMLLARAGASELEMEFVELGDCAGAALEALSLEIEESETYFTIEPLPALRGDRALLTVLFQNLISNAIKFSASDKPEVCITCAEEDGELVVGVKDNGIGMQPEYTEQIFAPFKRLHGRSEFSGSGIGLAITRKAVERHKGSIWVESSPGAGSHFKFKLGGMQMPSSSSASRAA